VFEDEGNRRGVEPRVQGVEHRARHWHAEMGFQHRRRVRAQDRNDVAVADAALFQG